MAELYWPGARQPNTRQSAGKRQITDQWSRRGLTATPGRQPPGWKPTGRSSRACCWAARAPAYPPAGPAAARPWCPAFRGLGAETHACLRAGRKPRLAPEEEW